MTNRDCRTCRHYRRKRTRDGVEHQCNTNPFWVGELDPNDVKVGECNGYEPKKKAKATR